MLRNWGITAGATTILGFVAWQLAVGYLTFVVAELVFNLFRFDRQLKRFAVHNAEGLAALSRGEMNTARDIFWRWAETAKQSRISTFARHNLAWTLTHQGQLQQAVEILLDNEERNPNALQNIALFPTSAVDLAFNYALLGDIASAERWLTEAERRGADPRTLSFPGMRALSRAVLDCRRDRCDDAARMLAEQWAQCEAVLTGDTLRPLKIVRAFAITASGPRNAGLADMFVTTARPAYPGEYDFLGAAWPEMAAFLASHNL